jgi:beta-barrel assembly-enhancing protease
MKNFAIVFCYLFFGFSILAVAQKEVPQDINLTGATIIEFSDPYREMTIYAQTDEDGRHSLLLIQDTTLFVRKAAFAKKKKSIKKDEITTAVEFKPGMKINISLDYYQLSQRNIVKRIGLDESYYGPANVTGLFEQLDSNTAMIDGQAVRLALGKKESIEGLDEWKGKKFTSFADMQLGAKLDLSGERRPDGIVYVNRGTMQPTELSKEARLLRKAIAPAVLITKGTLTIADGWKFRLTPNNAVQEYVGAVGRKLVPKYLSGLAPVHPDFIDFAFYVVDEPSLGIFSYPNGTVVVPSGLLKIMENEAQLAAVLAHEIAHITNKHGVQQLRQNASWEAIQTFGATNTASATEPMPIMVSSTIGELSVAVFMQIQETQADRIGLNYAVQAGYDPREAATVWKKLTEVQTDDILAAQRTSALNWLQKTYKPGSSDEKNKAAEALVMQPVFPGHAHPLDRFRHVRFLLATAYAPFDLSKYGTMAGPYKTMLNQLRGNATTSVTAPVPTAEKPAANQTKNGKSGGGKYPKTPTGKPTIKPAAAGKPTIKSLPVKG